MGLSLVYSSLRSVSVFCSGWRALLHAYVLQALCLAQGLVGQLGQHGHGMVFKSKHVQLGNLVYCINPKTFVDLRPY
jgi:hypothetical protein